MVTFKDLVPLAKKYNYDLNHNLRYLALAKLVECYHINEILILGCGKGILEYILPEEIKCTSIDINPEEIEIAKEINKNKKNRLFIVEDIFNLPKDYEKKFEGVVVSEVIEHIVGDEKVLNLVRQFMKPSNSVFILTVPNINRFRNKMHTMFGGKVQFMSDSHIREYSYNEIINLFDLAGFLILQTDHVYFKFPKEHLIRRFINVDSIIRKFILKINPFWADYIITVSIPKQHAGSEIKAEKYLVAYETERFSIVRRLYSRVPFKKNWRVLDIGSGMGFYSDVLANFSNKIICMDLSTSNVQICRDKGYSAVLYNAEKGLSFKDSSFDFINALEIIEHLNNPQLFVSELKRILKPRQFLLMSTANKNSPEGWKGKIVERIKGVKWNAWDRTHRHIFSYKEFLELLKTEFDIVYVKGYYFGFTLFNRHFPPFLWKLSTSNEIFRKLGFNTIILIKNKR